MPALMTWTVSLTWLVAAMPSERARIILPPEVHVVVFREAGPLLGELVFAAEAEEIAEAGVGDRGHGGAGHNHRIFSVLPYRAALDVGQEAVCHEATEASADAAEPVAVGRAVVGAGESMAPGRQYRTRRRRLRCRPRPSPFDNCSRPARRRAFHCRCRSPAGNPSAREPEYRWWIRWFLGRRRHARRRTSRSSCNCPIGAGR